MTLKKLYSWGEGYGGQLGEPMFHVSKPTQLGAATYLSVAQSYSNVHAVKTDGTLWVWGYSGAATGMDSGQNITRSSPVQVGALTNWSRVEAHGEGESVYAIKTDGTLWAWGRNTSGQLGDGTTTLRSSPVQIGALTDWESIAAGVLCCHGIRTNGTLWGWGENGFGTIGDNTIVSKSSPVQIGALTDWAELAGGYYHTLAVRDNNTLWAWGDPSSGCLGDGFVITRSSPVQIGGAVWAKAGAGQYTSHAIRTDGTLWGWGESGYGGVGDGTLTSRSSPVQVGAATNWAKVRSSRYTTNAIKTDGTLWGWGRSEDYGQAGIDTLMTRSTPVQAGTDTDWAGSLCLRRYNSRLWVLKTNGTLWFAGSAEYDPRGDERDYYNSFRVFPVQVGTLTDWESVSGDGETVAALKQNGKMFGWGGGVSSYGYGFTQTIIGDGEASKRGSPVQVGAQAWTKVEPYLGLRSDGTLWVWGQGSLGQLGNLTTSGTNLSPIQVGAATDWTDIAATGLNRFAIKTGNTLWAWGSGTSGALGDGTTVNKSSPVQIGGAVWSKVSAGYVAGFSSVHCLATRTDGTLWGWGRNDNGQIGDSTITHRSSPVQIGVANTWNKISADGGQCAAIKADGTLWTWGRNNVGQLGIGDITNRSAPVQVGALTDWSDVKCGSDHVIALKIDGTIWAWGANSTGQVGDSSVIARSSPVQIGTARTWTAIGAAGITSFGVQRVVSSFWTGFVDTAETDE